jgi:hypothetical protein
LAGRAGKPACIQQVDHSGTYLQKEGWTMGWGVARWGSRGGGQLVQRGTKICMDFRPSHSIPVTFYLEKHFISSLNDRCKRKKHLKTVSDSDIPSAKPVGARKPTIRIREWNANLSISSWLGMSFV